MLQCPFEIGLWLDLDCESLGNLEPIFEYIDPVTGIALARIHEKWQEDNLAQGLILPGEVAYSSGVIAFYPQSVVIKKWAEISLINNHLFIGDQDILSRLIFNEGHAVGEIPLIYNWYITYGINISVVVAHWGGKTKEILKSHGGFRKMNDG